MMTLSKIRSFLDRHFDAVFFLLLGILGLCVFAPGLQIQYYGDDFGYILDPAKNTLPAFWTQGNLHGWYRPIQMTYMFVVQQAWGWSTLPIHALQLLAHITLAYGVYRLARSLPAGRLQAAIAALWMLLSQADPLAVQRTTTLSSTLAACFGFFAVSLLLRQERQPGRRKFQPAAYCAALVCFLLALFSKESGSILIVIVAAIFIFLRIKPLRVGFHPTRGNLLAFLPFLVVFCLYFIIRQSSGANPPVFGSGDYEFTLSATILKNVALLLLAGVTPVSTVTTFLAAQAGSPLLLSICILAPACIVGVAVYGLASSREWKSGLVLFCLALLSLFPMAGLNHVSELYVYQALPYLSLLIGIGWGAAAQAGAASGRRARILIVLLLSYGLVSVLSLESKTLLMSDNGRRAETILRQLPGFAERVPAGGQLLLVNPPEKTPSYSVFLIRGFDVFSGARQIVQQAAGRSDFSVRITGVEELAGGPLDPDVVAVTLRGDTVVAYP
jgi:hypothetical protein